MPTGVPVSKEFVSIDTPSVILETLKKVIILPIVIQYTAVMVCLYWPTPLLSFVSLSQSENRDDAVVLRFYEAYGGRTRAKIQVGFVVKNAFL